MKFGLVDVFVDDQDRARGFYAGTLGVEVNDDTAYGESGRWLTVVSPEAALRESGTPAVSCTTDDCARSFRELRQRGVVVVPEARAMGYGGIDAVFEDGCGNLLNPDQHAPPDPAGEPHRCAERWP